jgi:sugar O-acyltransferase (sialic acid O-acetyltransferase NeuD family)
MVDTYGARDWNAELRALKSIVILGAGGGAREAFWMLLHVHPDVKVVFVDDTTDRSTLDIAGRIHPVVNDWNFDGVRKEFGSGEAGSFRQFIIGLGTPRDKKIMVEKALSHGLQPAPTPIHPTAIVGDDCVIGRGGFVMAFCVITTGVTIGDYVLIENTSVGHDAAVGSYASCYSGGAISGDSSLGEGGLLGAGAVIRDEKHVADWVTIGAQSFVHANIEEPGAIYVGVPARRIGVQPIPGQDTPRE